MVTQQIVVDLYCRVSTDIQEDNTSLDEQEAGGRTYCQKHGLVVGLVHREIWSGYQYREREKLSIMRERYRDGKIQGVVIRTLDRLSRSQVHNAILMEEMEHHNVVLHCVKENIDDSPMGKFIRMVLAFVAEMEREKIMDRTSSGRISKAMDGNIVAGSKAPYGWLWQYHEDGSKEVVLHPEQAAVRRWLAEQYAAGVSAYSLVNQLNEDGTPAPNGQEWNDRTIRRLLFDPRVTGKNAQIFAYQNRKTKQPLEPIDLPDGTYPAIIDEALFARVLAQRTINTADAIRASKEPEEYMLRAGFIRCSRCKKPMMAAMRRSNYVYRCSHSTEHTNVILSKRLDEEVWQWLQKLADHIDLIEKAIALATSSDTIDNDTAAIEQSIANWQLTADNYLSDLEDRSLVGQSRTAIRGLLNNANLVIAQLEEERAQLVHGLVDKEREQAAYQEILDWCKKVKEAREELSYAQKRTFMRVLGIVVIVENEKPYYENMKYHIAVALPAVQELMLPYARVNSDTASQDDVEVTEQLIEAGRLLEIELLDHIVIGAGRFVSLKEQLKWT